MEKKHTPGPWRIHQEGEKMGVFCNSLVTMVAMLKPYRMTEARRVANARLIAAAPELLDDLESLVLSCQAALPYNHPALVNARASIARATGQEV